MNVGDGVNLIPHALQLPLSSIFENYSHVLFATGCTLPVLHADLPPSEYCIPALSLVHWYTQHPNAPKPLPLHKISHVSIIGHGNVSLDVARMLLTNVSELSKYDVPSPVLDVLSKSAIKHVSIIGRRGPPEAAFTMKELREMTSLPEASMVPLDPSLLAHSPSLLTRQQSRVVQLLEKGSKNAPGSTEKTWSLDFFRSPTGLALPSRSSSHSRLPAQLSLSHTTLNPHTHRAVPTGKSSTFPTDLVITSLGFHAEPSSTFYDPSIAHLRTMSGRIVTSEGTTLRNVYGSGWAATGAKGVLALTMMNAYDTARTIVDDWMGGDEDEDIPDREEVLNNDLALDLEKLPEEVEEAIVKAQVMQYGDWKKVDDAEVERGGKEGKERERMKWEEARTFLMQAL